MRCISIVLLSFSLVLLARAMIPSDSYDIFSFPRDILCEIFLHSGLFLTDVSHCAQVCTKWNVLITDPLFIADCDAIYDKESQKIFACFFSAENECTNEERDRLLEKRRTEIHCLYPREGSLYSTITELLSNPIEKIQSYCVFDASKNSAAIKEPFLNIAAQQQCRFIVQLLSQPLNNGDRIYDAATHGKNIFNELYKNDKSKHLVDYLLMHMPQQCVMGDNRVELFPLSNGDVMALFAAVCAAGKCEVVESFINNHNALHPDNSALPSLVDSSGNTLFHLVCKNGFNQAIADLFLRKKWCNLLAVNNKGETPFDLLSYGQANNIIACMELFKKLCENNGCAVHAIKAKEIIMDRYTDQNLSNFHQLQWGSMLHPAVLRRSFVSPVWHPVPPLVENYHSEISSNDYYTAVLGFLRNLGF